VNAASIVFGLVAKDQASTALAKVRGELGLLSGAAGRVTPALAGIGAALGVGVSAVGFVAYAAKVRDELLAIKDLSEATGASIEAISGLENVARAAGGTLEDVSGVLVRFNGVLKDADGANRASQVLKALGLDAQALRRADPAEALRQTAVALSRFADDGDKARAVQELFGKSVREAGPLLRELAQAGALQGTVTARQVEEMDRFNKEVAALKANLTDLARVTAGPATRAINALFEEFRAGREAFGGRTLAALFDLGFNVDPTKTLEENLRRTRDTIKDTEASLKALRQTMFRNPLGFTDFAADGMAMDLERLRARERYLQRIIGLRGGEQASYSNEGRNAARALVLPALGAPPTGAARAMAAQLMGPPLAAQSEAWQAAVRAIEATDGAKLEALQEQIRMLIYMRQAPGAETERVDQALQAVSAQMVGLVPAAASARAAQQELAALLAATPAAEMARSARQAEALWAALGGATDPAQIEQINQALARTLGLVERTGEGATDTATAMSTFADQAGRNIQNALGDTLEQVLGGNFSNIGRMWSQLLVRMAAQAAAARLSQQIFGTAFQAGGSLGPWGQVLRNFFGGGRADGGPVLPGMTYLVGERGPELLTMGGNAGRITPNDALVGAGLTINNTINLSGDVGPGTVRLVEQALARERNRAARQAYTMGAA
jgi:hypothetical protein